MKLTRKAFALGLCLIAFSPNGKAEPLYQEAFSNVTSDRQWAYCSWQGQNQRSGGIVSDGTEFNGSLAVGAVTEGYAGWISPAIKLAAKEGFTLTFKVKASPDYAGNDPRAFVTWFQDGKLLKPYTLNMTPSDLESARDGWAEVILQVPASAIPAEADSFHVNLSSKAKDSGDSPAGTLYFKDVTVEAGAR